MISIFVGAIVMFAVGALWFTVLFGMLWSKLMNRSAEDMARAKAKGMAGQMVVMFILNLVSSYAVYYLFQQLLVFSDLEFISSILLIWAGFTLPSLVNTYLWEGKSLKLVAINAGGSLAAFIAGSVTIYLLS